MDGSISCGTLHTHTPTCLHTRTHMPLPSITCTHMPLLPLHTARLHFAHTQNKPGYGQGQGQDRALDGQSDLDLLLLAWLAWAWLCAAAQLLPGTDRSLGQDGDQFLSKMSKTQFLCSVSLLSLHAATQAFPGCYLGGSTSSLCTHAFCLTFTGITPPQPPAFPPSHHPHPPTFPHYLPLLPLAVPLPHTHTTTHTHYTLPSPCLCVFLPTYTCHHTCMPTTLAHATLCTHLPMACPACTMHATPHTHCILPSPCPSLPTCRWRFLSVSPGQAWAE